MDSIIRLLMTTTLLLIASACNAEPPTHSSESTTTQHSSTSSRQLAEAALARTYLRVRYDGRYQSIGYPGGDVADNRGVCTDVVIRAYRAIGIDLQVRIHEDMTKAFDQYPNRWGLTRPDPNIDHRRVPNLEQYFTRMGAALPIDHQATYAPGDIVSWRLPNGRPHIGIVHSRLSRDGKRPLVVHNIGMGPVLDDSLFRFNLNGHFRYLGTGHGVEDGGER